MFDDDLVDDLKDSYECFGFKIPDYMMGSLNRYIREGSEVGGFLTAVLEGDLFGALRKADSQNQKNLPAYAYYLYNEAPSGCYGSKAKVKAWREARAKAREKADGEN